MNLFVWLILGVVIGALLAARLLAPVLGGGPGQGFFSLTRARSSRAPARDRPNSDPGGYAR